MGPDREWAARGDPSGEFVPPEFGWFDKPPMRRLAFPAKKRSREFSSRVDAFLPWVESVSPWTGRRAGCERNMRQTSIHIT